MLLSHRHRKDVVPEERRAAYCRCSKMGANLRISSLCFDWRWWKKTRGATNPSILFGKRVPALR